MKNNKNLKVLGVIIYLLLYLMPLMMYAYFIYEYGFLYGTLEMILSYILYRTMDKIFSKNNLHKTIK